MEEEKQAPEPPVEPELTPQDLLVAIVLAELQGRPLIPAWYTLRLLPYLEEPHAGSPLPRAEILF